MTGKYSVIFLHDGGSTRRWRMGPTSVRTLLFLFILMPLVAAASLWLNWTLWQDLNAVRSENLALQRQVDANAQTTARLANLEQFLRKTDPQGLDALLPTRSGGGFIEWAHETQTTSSFPPPVPASSAEAAAPTPPAPAPQAEPALPEETGADPARFSVAPAVGPEAETPTAPPSAEDAVDSGLARVENLNARRVGARSLRISFDLYNTELQPQLAGKATFELMLADGSTYPLDDHGDTSYRINRLKKIVGNPTLPAEVTDTEGASIRISVFNDGDLIYRVTTPLRQ